MAHPVLDCGLLDVGLEAGVYEPRPAEGADVGDENVLPPVMGLQQTFQAALRQVPQSFDAARWAAHRAQNEEMKLILLRMKVD